MIDKDDGDPLITKPPIVGKQSTSIVGNISLRAHKIWRLFYKILCNYYICNSLSISRSLFIELGEGGEL